VYIFAQRHEAAAPVRRLSNARQPEPPPGRRRRSGRPAAVASR